MNFFINRYNSTTNITETIPYLRVHDAILVENNTFICIIAVPSWKFIENEWQKRKKLFEKMALGLNKKGTNHITRDIFLLCIFNDGNTTHLSRNIIQPAKYSVSLLIYCEIPKNIRNNIIAHNSFIDYTQYFVSLIDPSYILPVRTEYINHYIIEYASNIYDKQLNHIIIPICNTFKINNGENLIYSNNNINYNVQFNMNLNNIGTNINKTGTKTTNSV